MGNDIVFSVFDTKKGPVTLYSTIESPDISKLIAVKSFIAIGAMEEANDLESKDAVLSFPSLSKIALIYMFKLSGSDPTTGKPISYWATIGFTHESASSADFYRAMPYLQKAIVDLVKIIKKNVTYLAKETKLTKSIIDQIESLKNTDLGKKLETAVASALDFEEFTEGDLTFLFEYFPKDLGMCIYSLLMEESVLIVGDIKDIVNKIVASLKLIVPHRFLTAKYAMQYIDPKLADLIICSPNVSFLKDYSQITRVDVNKRKISSRFRGYPSIDDLVHTLNIAPKGSHESVIHTYIDKLLAKTAELMELCEQEQISRDEIRVFRTVLKADELNIVISMVKNFAPQFESKLFHFARSIS